MTTLGRALLIARKDLRLEFRTRDIVTSAGLFALLVVVTASFAFPTWGRGREGVAAGVLWMAFLFAGLLGIGRSFAIEKEDACMDGLLLSPAGSEAIFLGKLLATLAFTFVIELVTLPIFVVLLQLSPDGGTLVLILTALLGTLGLAAVGSLFAAMAVNTKTREVILPLLVLPVAVPLLIASVEATTAALGGHDLSSAQPWLLVMAAYDAVFLLVGMTTFRFVTEA
ncbi:MAG TPA: heme exporter protein CcmB [Actinomycetota bacterium]|nr:heme exporter protein CcmB [Actinomycetota bacterium]